MKRKASIVIPIFNEAQNIRIMLEALEKMAVLMPAWQFEVVFVDDGSTDGSIEIIKLEKQAHLKIEFIKLTRNFGHQVAIQAGMNVALGDIVITMDGDLQHPPEYIPEMIRTYLTGFDIVQMVRKNQSQGLKGYFSSWFYTCFSKISKSEIIPNAADFRLLSRKVINFIKTTGEQNKFLRVYIPAWGFKQKLIYYEENKRVLGKASYTFKKSLSLAIKALFDYSTFPLRVVFSLGFFIAIISFLFGIFSIINKLFFNPNITSGYTDIIVAILFFSGCILISIGIIGRYLLLILEEVRKRPLYVIDKATNPNFELHP